MLVIPTLADIPLHLKPRVTGALVPNTPFDYQFDFTSDQACTNILSTYTEIVTTNNIGEAFIILNTSGLNQTPSYLCEYRDSVFRVAHNISDGVFNKVRAKNFYGVYDWNISDESILFLSFNGTSLYFNETSLNLSTYANYQFKNNNFNGTGNFSTTGKILMGGDGTYDIDLLKQTGIAWTQIKTNDNTSYAQIRALSGVQQGIGLSSFGNEWNGSGSTGNGAYRKTNAAFQSNADAFSITNERSNGKIQFYCDGYEGVNNIGTITSSGLGLFTDSPLAPIHIQNNVVSMTFGGFYASNILANSYYNGTYKYIRNNPAIAVIFPTTSQTTGDFSILNAPNGTAGTTITNWTYRLYLSTDGRLALGNITNPAYPLVVPNDINGISIWAGANISATGYITRTSVFDKSKGNATQYIKDSDNYLTNGTVNHKKFYGYVNYTNIDYSKPVITNKTNLLGNLIIEYPYNITEEGVNLEAEINVLRQALYETTAKQKILEEEIQILKDKIK